jgi:hypothetical protein
VRTEFDCEYTDAIVCPYCGHEQSDSWEICGDRNDGETDCGECEKKFSYSRDFTVNYTTHKSACLNGEAPHDLRKAYEWTGWEAWRCRNCRHEERRQVPAERQDPATPSRPSPAPPESPPLGDDAT